MQAPEARDWQKNPSHAADCGACPNRSARFASPSTLAPTAKMVIGGWKQLLRSRYTTAELDFLRCPFFVTCDPRDAATTELRFKSLPFSLRQNQPSADQVWNQCCTWLGRSSAGIRLFFNADSTAAFSALPTLRACKIANSSLCSRRK